MITKNTIRDYIELQLDLFLLLMLPDKRLKGKPKEIFIEHVLCSIEGIDINSTECIERIRDKFNFDYSNDVWQYRSRLKRAGWFIKEYPKNVNSTQGIYRIIPNFDFTKKDFKETRSYSFVLGLKEKESKS